MSEQRHFWSDFAPILANGQAHNGRMSVSPDGILTVAEVVREFCIHRKDIYSERSFTERKPVLDRFVQFMGDRAISQCRPLDLDRWILSQTGWKSAATRKTHWSMIQAVFNWAGRVRLIAENPFRSGESPEEGEPRPAVPDEHLLALLRHTDACFRRFLLMLRTSSLREGELCDLVWPWVNLGTGIVTLERHKSRKRTRKVKVVPLTIPAHKMLLYLRSRQYGDGHVFLNADGNPWTRTNISTRMQRLRKRAGVPDWVKPHGLRHKIGTEAVGAGASVKLVSEGLGHSQTAITERYYVHLAGEHLEGVREALGQGAHISVRK